MDGTSLLPFLSIQLAESIRCELLLLLPTLILPLPLYLGRRPGCRATVAAMTDSGLAMLL